MVTATANGGADEARALATAVRDRLPAGAPGAVGVGAEAGVVVVALNKAALEAGLNAAALVKQPLGARGGGLAADRLADTLAELPRLMAAADPLPGGRGRMPRPSHGSAKLPPAVGQPSVTSA
ncbi:hypothetical protein ACFWWA_27930 [Streptomyces goshikiensis]|uniref:hypothetical protein n=1 Tax=Streptomyces goshikiensis TaxID=1942 RepID=UPI00364D82B5